MNYRKKNNYYSSELIYVFPSGSIFQIQHWMEIYLLQLKFFHKFLIRDHELRLGLVLESEKVGNKKTEQCLEEKIQLILWENPFLHSYLTGIAIKGRC